MPLKPQVLAAIQSAGAAVFDADAALQSATKDYAKQIEAALVDNPFDVSNDALFEEWKNVARLSQAVGQIEQELRQIFEATARVSNPASLAMPETRRISTAPVSLVNEINATDVVAKLSKVELRGNSALVLKALLPFLTDTEFRKINISAVALDAGVAQGSMAATLKRLIRDGHLVEAKKGYFKLTGPN